MAPTGFDARRIAERLSPHLTVLDAETPGENGWETCARLGMENPRLRVVLLAAEPDLLRIDHPHNRGYGAALISAFAFALRHDYDILVTMDCDGQHEPSRIPVLLEAIHDGDIVSGSRYLRDFRQRYQVEMDTEHIA